jgi:hypothetical protein
MGADLTPEDMSHALLIAVLMANGGSVELSAEALEPDALGTPDGTWHALELLPLPGGGARLSVVPRPDMPGSGMDRRGVGG